MVTKGNLSIIGGKSKLNVEQKKSTARSVF